MKCEGIEYNRSVTYFENLKLIFEVMSLLSDHITIDKEIQGGQPVFSGTRVPVQSLFWHLEKGISIDDFLDDFPSVTRKQVNGVLEIANKLIGSDQIGKFYEAVA